MKGLPSPLKVHKDRGWEGKWLWLRIPSGEFNKKSLQNPKVLVIYYFPPAFFQKVRVPEMVCFLAFINSMFVPHLDMLPERSRSFNEINPLSENVFSSPESRNFFDSDLAGRSNVFVVKLGRAVGRLGAEKSFIRFRNNLELECLNDNFLKKIRTF